MGIWFFVCCLRVGVGVKVYQCQNEVDCEGDEYDEDQLVYEYEQLVDVVIVLGLVFGQVKLVVYWQVVDYDEVFGVCFLCVWWIM